MNIDLFIYHWNKLNTCFTDPLTPWFLLFGSKRNKIFLEEIRHIFYCVSVLTYLWHHRWPIFTQKNLCHSGTCQWPSELSPKNPYSLVNLEWYHSLVCSNHTSDCDTILFDLFFMVQTCKITVSVYKISYNVVDKLSHHVWISWRGYIFIPPSVAPWTLHIIADRYSNFSLGISWNFSKRFV